MDLVQAAELETQRVMKSIEVDFPAILIDIPEYKSESDGLALALTDSDIAIKVQAKIPAETANSVNSMKRDMAETLEGIVERCISKANSVNNTELASSVDFSFSYFYFVKKEEAVQRAEAVEKQINDNLLTVFTNIKDTEMTALRAKILKYSTSKEVPIKNRQKKKAGGTDALTISLKKGTGHKNMMAKLLIRKYKKLNPEIAERAGLANKVIVLGKRHNVGSYSVINRSTEEAVLTAVITEVRTSVKKKKVKTVVYQLDGNGMRIFNTHILGKAVLTVVVPGFLNETMTVTFKKNDPNEFVIGLTRVLPK